MNDSEKEVLIRWQRNCRRSQIANYAAANLFSRRNYMLGIPAVVLSSIVGAGVFGTLQQEKLNVAFQMSLGGLSVVAAVLAALQTFFKWGELASKFRAAAAEYGAIKREIDQLLASPTGVDKTMTTVRMQMDTIARDAPEIPKRIWDKARQDVPTSGSDTE